MAQEKATGPTPAGAKVRVSWGQGREAEPGAWTTPRDPVLWGGGRWPGNGCLGGTGRAEGTWESPACVCLCVCTCSGINMIHLIAHYQKASFFSPWPCFNDPCRDPSSLNLLPESRQLRQSQWGGSRGDPAPVPCLGLSQAPSFPASQQPPPSDPETPPWVPGEPDLQMSNMARTIAIY